MAKIDAFFNLMDEVGASDLHLASGSQPILRVRGEMERVKFPNLENDELKSMLSGPGRTWIWAEKLNVAFYPNLRRLPIIAAQGDFVLLHQAD